jgi:ABC-2 type transport system permease protein
MSKKQLLKAILGKLKSIFMLVLFPILFMLIFGYAFSKVYVEQIPFGILDLDNSSTSRSIIDQFKKSEGFKVVYYAQSEDDIKDAINRKKIRAGLIIPKDFDRDVLNMKSPKTILLIDETNLVIGNNALAYGSEILNTLNGKIQLNVLEENNMLPYTSQQAINSLSFTERMLYDPQMSYMKYQLYGILGVLIQQTYLSVLVPILMREKSNIVKIKIKSKQGIKRILIICVKILTCILLSITGAAISLYVAGRYLHLPLRGTVIDDFILFGIFMMNLTALAFVFSFVFKLEENFIRFCMYLSVPTLLTAGYAWPEYMMPSGFAHDVKSIWPLIDLANPLRIINLKGVDLKVILPYIKSGIYYGLFWLPVGIGLYIIKIVVVKAINRKVLVTKEN